jgi:ABC-type antimicrobial peptide transport system, permease component
MAALIWKDLRHHARQWLWSLLVTTTGGAFIDVIIVSWYSALRWSATQADASKYSSMTSILGSNLVSYAGLSIAVIVSSTLALTVTAQSRSHALWKIIGIPSRRIRRVILAQIGAVGMLGGLIGGILALPVTGWYLLTWHEFHVYPADMPVVMPAFAVPLTIAITTAFSILGGLGAARRAASTPEMQALREAASPAARTRIWQWIVAGVFLFGVTVTLIIAVVNPSELTSTEGADPQTAAEMAGRTNDDLMGLGGALVLMLMIAALCVPNWTIRPLLTAWTALIPGRSPAWFAARANARHRSTMSLTTIVPFGIAVGMTGVVYAIVGATRASGADGGVSGFLAIAVPIFIISGAGGVAQHRDGRLHLAAGGSPAGRYRGPALHAHGHHDPGGRHLRHHRHPVRADRHHPECCRVGRILRGRDARLPRGPAVEHARAGGRGGARARRGYYLAACPV